MKDYILLIVIIIGLFISCKLSANDNVYKTIGNTSIILDWAQTRHLSRNYDKGLFETNNILGKYPHHDKVDIYFASCLLLYNYIGNNYINEPMEKVMWYGIIPAIQFGTMYSNKELGLRFRF